MAGPANYMHQESSDVSPPIGNFGFRENPAVTFRFFEAPHDVSTHFYHNPLLNIPARPTRVQKGTDKVRFYLPPERKLFYWELSGYLKAPETNRISFRAQNALVAKVQFGYKSGYRPSSSNKFAEMISDELTDATTRDNDFQVVPGEIYPIRFLLVTDESQIQLTYQSEIPPPRLLHGIMQAEWQPYRSQNHELWQPTYSNLGFDYRTSVAPVRTQDITKYMKTAVPSMDSGFIGPEFTGAMVPRVRVPHAMEIWGHFVVPETGIYSFNLADDSFSAIQVGPPSKSKHRKYAIENTWRLIDSRMNPKSNIYLLKNRYYPFRVVVLGNETDPQEQWPIESFDPRGKRFDIFSLSDSPSVEKEDQLLGDKVDDYDVELSDDSIKLTDIGLYDKNDPVTFESDGKVYVAEPEPKRKKPKKTTPRKIERVSAELLGTQENKPEVKISLSQGSDSNSTGLDDLVTTKNAILDLNVDNPTSTSNLKSQGRTVGDITNQNLSTVDTHRNSTELRDEHTFKDTKPVSLEESLIESKLEPLSKEHSSQGDTKEDLAMKEYPAGARKEISSIAISVKKNSTGSTSLVESNTSPGNHSDDIMLSEPNTIMNPLVSDNKPGVQNPKDEQQLVSKGSVKKEAFKNLEKELVPDEQLDSPKSSISPGNIPSVVSDGLESISKIETDVIAPNQKESLNSAQVDNSTIPEVEVKPDSTSSNLKTDIEAMPNMKSTKQDNYVSPLSDNPQGQMGPDSSPPTALNTFSNLSNPVIGNHTTHFSGQNIPEHSNSKIENNVFITKEGQSSHYGYAENNKQGPKMVDKSNSDKMGNKDNFSGQATGIYFPDVKVEGLSHKNIGLDTEPVELNNDFGFSLADSPTNATSIISDIDANNLHGNNADEKIQEAAKQVLILDKENSEMNGASIDNSSIFDGSNTRKPRFKSGTNTKNQNNGTSYQDVEVSNDKVANMTDDIGEIIQLLDVCGSNGDKMDVINEITYAHRNDEFVTPNATQIVYKDPCFGCMNETAITIDHDDTKEDTQANSRKVFNGLSDNQIVQAQEVCTRPFDISDIDGTSAKLNEDLIVSNRTDMPSPTWCQKEVLDSTFRDMVFGMNNTEKEEMIVSLLINESNAPAETTDLNEEGQISSKDDWASVILKDIPLLAVVENTTQLILSDKVFSKFNLTYSEVLCDKPEEISTPFHSTLQKTNETEFKDNLGNRSNWISSLGTAKAKMDGELFIGINEITRGTCKPVTVGSEVRANFTNGTETLFSNDSILRCCDSRLTFLNEANSRKENGSTIEGKYDVIEENSECCAEEVTLDNYIAAQPEEKHSELLYVNEAYPIEILKVDEELEMHFSSRPTQKDSDNEPFSNHSSSYQNVSNDIRLFDYMNTSSFEEKHTSKKENTQSRLLRLNNNNEIDPGLTELRNFPHTQNTPSFGAKDETQPSNVIEKDSEEKSARPELFTKPENQADRIAKGLSLLSKTQSKAPSGISGISHSASNKTDGTGIRKQNIQPNTTVAVKMVFTHEHESESRISAQLHRESISDMGSIYSKVSDISSCSHSHTSTLSVTSDLSWSDPLNQTSSMENSATFGSSPMFYDPRTFDSSHPKIAKELPNVSGDLETPELGSIFPMEDLLRDESVPLRNGFETTWESTTRPTASDNARGSVVSESKEFSEDIRSDDVKMNNESLLSTEERDSNRYGGKFTCSRPESARTGTRLLGSDEKLSLPCVQYLKPFEERNNESTTLGDYAHTGSHDHNFQDAGSQRMTVKITILIWIFSFTFVDQWL